MSPTTPSDEGQGAADRRAQTELTERVGVRLVQQGKSHNPKWRTWTSRFGNPERVRAKT
jgi:hypothetical protein